MGLLDPPGGRARVRVGNITFSGTTLYVLVQKVYC